MINEKYADRIEDLYAEKGYPKTEVTIIEGDELGDNDVIFLVHEDKLQRIAKVGFEGNEIASDGRLKSMIKMKPGILWFFGGKSNRRELEQDRLRLESTDSGPRPHCRRPALSRKN